jgi:hypothetical protein
VAILFLDEVGQIFLLDHVLDVTGHRIHPTVFGLEMPIVFRGRLKIRMCESWVRHTKGLVGPLGVPK